MGSYAVKIWILSSFREQQPGLEKNVYFLASWAKFPSSRVDFPPVCEGFPYVFLYFSPSRSQNFSARSFPFCLFFPGLIVTLCSFCDVRSHLGCWIIGECMLEFQSCKLTTFVTYPSNGFSFRLYVHFVMVGHIWVAWS